MTVNVLGTPYTIHKRSCEDDPALNDCAGYCDKTTKEIAVRIKEDDSDLRDFDVYQRKVIRHEIIHAFLFESGLHEIWKHDQWGQDETYVDWIAVQFPKLLKAFEEAGCL